MSARTWSTWKASSRFRLDGELSPPPGHRAVALLQIPEDLHPGLVKVTVMAQPPDAMQLKVGIRVSQFTANVNSIEVDNISETFSTPTILLGTPISAISETTTTTLSQQSRFLGAGPRIGIEGAVPFARG